jgi:hypothetical protein
MGREDGAKVLVAEELAVIDGRSGAGEDGSCLAEEFDGIAGLGEDSDGARHLAGLLADDGKIGLVVAGEDEDVAGGELPGDKLHELQAAETGHGDVAEDEFGIEGAGGGESLLAAVGYAGIETVLAKDEA